MKRRRCTASPINGRCKSIAHIARSARCFSITWAFGCDADVSIAAIKFSIVFNESPLTGSKLELVRMRAWYPSRGTAGTLEWISLWSERSIGTIRDGVSLIAFASGLSDHSALWWIMWCPCFSNMALMPRFLFWLFSQEYHHNMSVSILFIINLLWYNYCCTQLTQALLSFLGRSIGLEHREYAYGR